MRAPRPERPPAGLASDLEHAVALAIGRVIAGKVIRDDPKLSKLDALAQLMAANDMAEQMAASVLEEARAAIAAYRGATGARAA